MATMLKFLNTSQLRIAYESVGAATASPMVLLHGWPDSTHTWDGVKNRLAGSGFHVLIPSLRGYGATTFHNRAHARNAQLGALVSDLIEFLDGMGLRSATLVGHDWGARIVYAMAALFPERVDHCIAMSAGWSGNAPDQPLVLAQAQLFWYQWFLATPRGEATLRQERREFTQYIWQSWSPGWEFSAAEFEQAASAFDNPDWCDVSLSYYRNRWGFIEPHPGYAKLESRLIHSSDIKPPTLVLHGTEDACNLIATSAGQEKLFSGPYKHVPIKGAGHFPQRERPQVVADTMIEWLETVTPP